MRRRCPGGAFPNPPEGDWRLSGCFFWRSSDSLLYREHSGEAIQVAVELALENHLSCSQGVKHLLLQGQAGPEFVSLKQWPATMIPDLSSYAQLGVVP